MAQQQIAQNNRIQAEEVYRHYYVLHGECLRLASVCSSLGFSYDRDLNSNKVVNIEDIIDNIAIFVDVVKNKLDNPNLNLT